MDRVMFLLARLAKWQTRWLQVPVFERTWGFKSPLRTVTGFSATFVLENHNETYYRLVTPAEDKSVDSSLTFKIHWLHQDRVMGIRGS